MKTLRLLLFVFAVALVAVSCSKDEDPEVGGKYETTYAKAVVSYEGQTFTEEMDSKAELEEAEMYMQV